MNEVNHEEDDGFVWAQMRMTRLVRLKQPGRVMSTWDQSGIMLEPWPVRRMCESSSSALGPGDPATCLRTQRARWRRSLSSLSHGHVAATRGERGETRATVFYWGQHLDTINAFYGFEPQDERHEEYNRWQWPPVPHEEEEVVSPWRLCPGGVQVPGWRVAAPAGRPAPPPAHQPGHSFSNCCLVPVVTALSAATESQRTSSPGQNINTEPRPQQRQSQWHHGGLNTPPAGGLAGPPVCEGGRAPGQDPPQQCLLSAAKIQTQQTCRHEDILPNRGMYNIQHTTSSYAYQKCWMKLFVSNKSPSLVSSYIIIGQISFLHHVFCFLSQVHKCT